MNLIWAEKLSYLSKVNTYILRTIIFYDVGAVNSPIFIQFHWFVDANQRRLFAATLLLSGRASYSYSFGLRSVSVSSGGFETFGNLMNEQHVNEQQPHDYTDNDGGIYPVSIKPSSLMVLK